jgi:hypothetical protein
VAPADGSARPAVEVRDQQGALLPRVTEADAGTLHRLGWAEWIGTGGRRHLRLTDSAPLAARSSRRSPGTRPVRGDKHCHIHGEGQLMGNPNYLREFIPTNN